MVAGIKRQDEPSVRIIRRYARGLALVWAVGWTSFVLAQAFLWPESPMGQTGVVLIVCLVLMCSALIGWRCEGIAAIVLFSEGCGALVILIAIKVAGHFTLMQVILAICAVALPPLVAGLLFHTCWRRSVEYRAAHMFKVATEWDIVSLVCSLIEALFSYRK